MESFLIYLLKASALLGIFYLSYLLLLRKETSFQLNRKFLLAGMLSAAILPLIYFTKKIYIQAQPQNFAFIPESTEVETMPTEVSIDWWQISGIIYLIITGFFLLRLCLQLSAVLKIILTGHFEKASGLKFLKTEENQLPFSFFNFIVFNPEKHSGKDLHLILEHEKVHAKQLHSVDILLANFLSCVLWFNPFAWIYKKTIEQNLEFIADRETVNTKAEIKEYQHALVKVSIADLKPALTNHFYQSFIKKRILMLNKKSSTQSPAWKLSLVMPLLLAFMLLFNVKTEAQVVPSQEADQQNEQQQKTETSEEIEADEQTDVNKEQEKFETIEIISDDEPGKVHIINVKRKNKSNHVEVLGSDPLYVINDKEYKSSRLENKYISLNSRIRFMSKEKATEIYGKKGKNGAVIIPNGTIIRNFDKKLQEAQEFSDSFKGSFLNIGKNGKPNMLEINSSKNSNDAIIHSSNVLTRKIKGKGSNNARFQKKSDYEIMNQNPWKVEVTGTKFSTDDSLQILDLTSEHIVGYQSVEVKPKNTTRILGSGNTLQGNTMIVMQSDPLYILNGKVQGKEFNKGEIDPKDIKKINVLKGDAATKKYGEDASDGVIEIYTKEFEGNTSHPVKTDFYVLHKNSNDENIENLKKMIKAGANIETEFENIQRNVDGDITAVSITAKTENGKMASASFQNSEGIPIVIIGLTKQGKLVVSSNYKDY